MAVAFEGTLGEDQLNNLWLLEFRIAGEFYVNAHPLRGSAKIFDLSETELSQSGSIIATEKFWSFRGTCRIFSSLKVDPII
jgi:hypothetical protein